MLEFTDARHLAANISYRDLILEVLVLPAILVGDVQIPALSIHPIFTPG